ncbi:MAG: divalent-cation tolerance protein CutA [Candidatus Methanospirareceae archaeon]
MEGVGKEDFIVVFCTTPKGEGEKIAKILVEERLAACVNVAEVNSFFRWKGKMEREEEALLVIKTHKRKMEEMIKRIREVHSYELPEIIALPIIAGYDKYLEWVEEETK